MNLAQNPNLKKKLGRVDRWVRERLTDVCVCGWGGLVVSDFFLTKNPNLEKTIVVGWGYF